MNNGNRTLLMIPEAVTAAGKTGNVTAVGVGATIIALSSVEGQIPLNVP
jgi:hypothetical protein